MKRNNLLVNIGYVFALICFLTSLFFRVYNNYDVQSEIATSFLGLGGILLLITSIYKIAVNKKNKSK